MINEDIKKLAHNLVNYSCSLKKGEKVLIDAIGVPNDLPIAIVEEAYKVGAYPFVNVIDNSIQRAIYSGLNEEQTKLWADIDSVRMKNMTSEYGAEIIPLNFPT